MESNKNKKGVHWLLLELSKRGFFYVTTSNFSEFKSIIREAQKIENEQTIIKKKGILHYSFSLN